MLESRAIEKSIIDQILNTHLYNILRDTYKESLSSRSNHVSEYLIELINLSNSLNDLGSSWVQNDFSSEDLIELSEELDIIGVNKNIDVDLISLSVVNLYLSINLLRIYPFINSENPKSDIFLSHSSWDAREVLGIKLLLQQNKLTAHVDWLDNKQMNFPRTVKKILGLLYEMVPIKNLEVIYKKVIDNHEFEVPTDNFISNMIIKKIKSSSAIFYVQSRHYDHSRWMPYELGLGEAYGKLVYRFPIKYSKLRKQYGKRSSFLVRYNSIIDQKGKFNLKEFNRRVKGK
ncbi:hypothetical protein [Lentibacillus salicampi]|uniref:TIR domain-containing protein n=1 Tax=Lentibacillus salicampi TaxID=175306 RepID=A0A4Y9ACK3_9BACI|nr:hypothetical protein [Lentibacillus salicampi]TFJ92124.1 hypothetical protein E4U82_14175 [Lentibacillus salicampi]